MKDRLEILFAVYRRFEEEARVWLLQAACRPGCAACCIDVGRMDMTTLEGLNVLRGMEKLSPGSRKKAAKRLRKDSRERRGSGPVRCAFLDRRDLCLIYGHRPFSCRQLYSVKPCEHGPPTVHRGAYALSRRFIEEIKKLDEGGLHGHMPGVVALLSEPDFLDAYLEGSLDETETAAWAERFGLAVNAGLTARSRPPSPG